MADEARLKIWEALFAKALQAIDSVGEPVFSPENWIKPVLDERRDAILQRLASDDRILRKTFKELDTLEYRPGCDDCLEIVKGALAAK